MKQTTFLDARRDDAIRALDPADKSLDDATQRRVAASMERIIAAPLHGAGPDRTSLTRRRLWLVPGVAAAGLAVALVGPALTHTERPAFAWTNTPSPVNAQAAAQAAAACTAALRQSVAEDRTGSVPTAIRPTIDLDMVKLVVSERRGNYMFVALGQGQATYSCLSPLTSPGQVQASGGGLPTPSTPALRLNSNDAIADGYTTGADNGREYASMVGYAGQDVTGVSSEPASKTSTPALPTATSPRGGLPADPRHHQLQSTGTPSPLPSRTAPRPPPTATPRSSACPSRLGVTGRHR